MSQKSLPIISYISFRLTIPKTSVHLMVLLIERKIPKCVDRSNSDNAYIHNAINDLL
ncbi:MAG: hypothetical protein ACTSVK_14885 [Promethearchaeota archaeon]